MLTVEEALIEPVGPVAPLRFLKAKAKVLLVEVPPQVTDTEGVPVLESTVADALEMVADVPLAPLMLTDGGVVVDVLFVQLRTPLEFTDGYQYLNGAELVPVE